MKEQSEQEEEIQRLEREDEILTAENKAENAKERVLFIAGSADRKTKQEEKSREVEWLEELKELNAAKAKLKVYSESVHSDDEEDNQSLPPLHERSVLSLPPQELLPHAFPAHQNNPNPTNQAQVPQPYQAIVTNSSTSHSPIYTSVSVPQPARLTHASKPTLPLPMQQAAFTDAPPTHTTISHDTSNDLVRTLAEAITANCIPISEPVVFTGDPLKYDDWKLSFFTLIDCLIAAWTVLEDRFGNPFLIGKNNTGTRSTYGAKSAQRIIKICVKLQTFSAALNQLCLMYKDYKSSSQTTRLLQLKVETYSRNHPG